MSDIGRRIREMREAQGLTLAELGARIGVSAQAVYNWENRQAKTLKGASLIRAAEALGVDLHVLMSDEPLQPLLPRDEQELLSTYRSLPAGHQVIALRLLKALK